MDVFSPKIAVFMGMAIAVPLFSLISKRIGQVADAAGVGVAMIIAIILLALIFRAEAYPWINGGQDQGVYVNMSSHYQHGGKISIEDNVLPELADVELKQAYIDNRQESSDYWQEKQFHPGVYYGGEKDYVFQFYHLHPLWMAIFSALFGDNSRGYALVFFSILSLVFLMLLTYELSSSRLAALSVGLLIAINPLHVFFSKWPVTEVVTLAFSSIGFYYLARAHRFAESAHVARWSLAIGCLSLSLLFFVRISGFLYLPLLTVIFMVGAWQYKIKQSRFGVDLILFSFACIAFYILSIFYGLKFSPNYSKFIYRLTFGKVVDGQWGWVMAVGFLTMVAFMASWFYLLGKSSFVKKNSKLLKPRILIAGMFLVIFAAATLSLYKVYKLGYSDAYNSDPWLGGLWHLSGSGVDAVVRSSVINWLIYSSPALMLLGGVGLLRRNFDIKVVLLMLLVIVPLGAFIVQTPVLPYQYYYARYLVSEAVPYAIVLCITVLFIGNSQNWRRLGIVAVILTIPLFGYYSFKQFGAEEGVRSLSVLKKIAVHVDEDDVLLIEPAGWTIYRFAVETPLRFYFGLKTFALPAKERAVFSNRLAKSFRNVWLLTPNMIDDERYVLKERLLHYDKVLERVGSVPTKVIEDFWHQELFLYVLKKPGYPGFSGESYKIGAGPHPVFPASYEIMTILGDGWHGLESDYVWSSGAAEILLKESVFPGNKWPRVMKLDIAPYAASKDRLVRIEVQQGDNRYDFNYSDSIRNTIEIPLTCKVDSEQCKLEFTVKNAISPQQLGQSPDERVLGFALYAFTFEGFDK